MSHQATVEAETMSVELGLKIDFWWVTVKAQDECLDVADHDV